MWQLYKVVSQLGSRRNFDIPGLQEDTRAIEKFLHAQRLESSGQLALALNAYNAVLAFAGTSGPYEAAERKIQELRGPRKEDLLADQKREAEIPRAPQPQSPAPGRIPVQYMRPGMPPNQDSKELESIVERILEEKMGAYLSRQKPKAPEPPSNPSP
jgi:hypothetical protein